MTSPELPITLVERVRDEADLCRNDGAHDIANLLDEVASRLGEMVEALLKYGSHRPACRISHRHPCSCGWTDLRATLRTAGIIGERG
jgi:hypothetical protein